MRRIICLFAALVFVLPASAAPRRRTVLDYFKMLPAKDFFDMIEPATSRMKWLQRGFAPNYPADNRSVVDLKNDFLRFPGDGAQEHLDVAVFRFQGRDTVAVLERYGWEEHLSLWQERRKGHLQEVTKSVFPFRLSDDVAFEVPRYGTTLRVLATTYEGQPTQKVVARFLWRDGRFVCA